MFIQETDDRTPADATTNTLFDLNQLQLIIFKTT